MFRNSVINLETCLDVFLSRIKTATKIHCGPFAIDVESNPGLAFVHLADERTLLNLMSPNINEILQRNLRKLREEFPNRTLVTVGWCLPSKQPRLKSVG